MLAGDFTAITSPACNGGKQIALKAPFVNNRLDPSLFDKPALKVASMLPAAADACGTLNWGAVNKTNEWQIVDKVDYQINAKHSILDSVRLPVNHDLHWKPYYTFVDGARDQ